MKYYIFDLDDTLYKNPKDLNKMYDINPDTELINILNNCPYKKYIYTNATYDHANIILNKLKIQRLFKKIYSRDTIPSMKPNYQSVRDVENNIIFSENNKDNNFVFFDDLLPNLKTAKKRGWKTVWISPFYDSIRHDFIDYSFPDIKSCMMYCNKYDI